MDLNWHCVSRLLLRKTGSTGHLPPGGPHRRLDLLLNQLVKNRAKTSLVITAQGEEFCARISRTLLETAVIFLYDKFFWLSDEEEVLVMSGGKSS